MNSEHSPLIVGGEAAEDLDILTLANIFVSEFLETFSTGIVVIKLYIVQLFWFN